MNLIIQPEFKNYVNLEQNNFQFGPDIYFAIGDVNFLKTHMGSKSQSQIHVFLISDLESISVVELRFLNPVSIFKKSDILKNSDPLIFALQNRLLDLKKMHEVQLIKAGAERKRSDLERLNSFLQNQSDEKKMALSQFHIEEQNKKNKEKKLLSFLDYLNSEYEKSDFILEVLKTIWLDLKKIGTFYRLGFIIQSHQHVESPKSYIIEFDGKIDRAKAIPFENIVEAAKLGQFLANVFKRPVGKLISFSTEKDVNQFIFFFEVQGSEYNSAELDAYMLDRISLLSIVVQRWYSESTENQILKQWQQIFKSYQNPVHVVDENFNLLQSNYFTHAAHAVDVPKKCYQVLASQNQPCSGCPLDRNQKINEHRASGQVCVHKIDYQVIVSDFTLDQKKYFFMIYENASEVSVLKSNLIQAEKMATIGQLSNHLAHELNNPLTGLKLYAEMLLTGNQLGSPIYENDMNEVLKAISRSQAILQDLNQFANETHTELQNLDFSEIVKKTMTLLKSILRNHRIFIDLKPVQISAQATYLQQVLFNLIKNACQAMSDKGTLKIYQIESENFNDFIIEDDGPGLPVEISNYVFKPFFTTKQADQGTGLGLFISKKLMNRMNAELIYNSKFRSQVNIGTQFILRFQK